VFSQPVTTFYVTFPYRSSDCAAADAANLDGVLRRRFSSGRRSKACGSSSFLG
jgi:hypothetical protein